MFANLDFFNKAGVNDDGLIGLYKNDDSGDGDILGFLKILLHSLFKFTCFDFLNDNSGLILKFLVILKRFFPSSLKFLKTVDYLSIVDDIFVIKNFILVL
jgi:hypothetical protein